MNRPVFPFRATIALAIALCISSLIATPITIGGLILSTVVINEFHYNGSDNTVPDEFIELYNPGDTPVDVSGWTLSDAVGYTFPPSTSIPALGYLVIGENPSALQDRYSITGVLGPWTGKLSADGECIDLHHSAGLLIDRVEYRAGFPWPTGADGAGSSAELINPALDNNLGGSWRASGSVIQVAATYIAAGASGWKYFKGTSEASNPVDAWRATSFDDSTWLLGQTPVGYKTDNLTYATTTLDDMRGLYSTVYFRKNFTIPAGSIPRQLKLMVQVDDGCVVWINGTEVGRFHVPDGQLAYNATGINHNRAWEEITINNSDSFLLGGTNVIAVHGLNTSLSGSSDFSMDLELTNITNTSTEPSPGRSNTVDSAANVVPPQIRQVSHSPNSPTGNIPVTVTARITDPDGMGSVSLSYQTVDPGSYIRLTDPAYSSAWTIVPMTDDGTNGDTVAGDSIYSCVLPASVQTHRRLVRYKITFADALGNSQTVPYADDEQPNFAYFIYNGVPAWTGGLRSTSTGLDTYSSAMQEAMPPFHLIANASDVSSSQSGNSNRFQGTVIDLGKVHDHIQFRVRGIGSTTVSGKNKWNFYFNRARDYQAYDNYGKPYKETWNNLLVNCNASPWASVNRGSAGVEEAVSNRIFQLGGMAAMNTYYFHFRVIDASLETGPTQFDGDLWGLYLGLEPTEGNFLDERDMADGNLYSIEGNNGDKKHQGPTQAVDSSDWIAFRDSVSQSGQTEQWYRDNVDLPTLYTFLALNRLIGNVDVRPGDNYRFYHRPTDDRWVIIPYDLDMQFIAAHHWGGTMDGVTVAGAPNVIRAISRHPNLAREYRNRCREILSLMGSDSSPNGGQIGQLIAEYAQFVNPSGVALTWADLDAAMWNLNPKTTGSIGATTGQSSHKGNFFRANYLDGTRGGLGGTTRTTSWIRTLWDPDRDGFSDHEGMMQWFTDYATNTWPGGTWNRKAMIGIGSGTDTDPYRQKGYGYKYLEWESLYGGWVNSNANPGTPANTDYPDQPVLTAIGDPAFPVNDLMFSPSAFGDPQGTETFAAWQWRIAEISAPGISGHVSGGRCKYEIETLASSSEIAATPATFSIPLGIVEAGKIYRVRTRYKDTSGNWSLWSEPAQFTATPASLDLIHYWNFNKTTSLTDFLTPTQTTGGASITPVLAGTSLIRSDDDEAFSAENARNGDLAATHLRLNNPIDSTLEFRIPSTGFENLIVKYETRRSGSGAGTQEVSYTRDGINWLPFATLTIADDDPVVQNLDFRPIPETNNNPHFAIKIAFLQGDGGIEGNHRFDNLTSEGNALPPSGYEAWKLVSFPEPSDRADDSISGPDANPSGDGVSNLMRYAHDVGPHAPVLHLMPQIGTVGANFVFRFRYDATKTDLAWRVTASNDLSDWNHMIFDSELTDPIPPLDDGWLDMPLPSSLHGSQSPDPRIFSRLEVKFITSP